jgi:hypothetical protein
MCAVPIFPVFGLIFIGVGVFGLLLSLYPRCEYPEGRLLAPIVKMLVLSGFGLLLLALDLIAPPCGSCSAASTRTVLPASLVLLLIFAYVLVRVLTFFMSPYYWRRRLSSWADHNHFAILDFGQLYSRAGEPACFRVVLRDASGKERRAEATFKKNAGFNLNHVNLVWLD